MRLVILLFLSVTIFSCQPKPERCQNEGLLLKPYGDSLPVFELSEGMHALEHFLDSVLALQLKDPENVMRFYLHDSLYTPCSFDPRAMGSEVRVCNLRSIFEILLNASAQLLVEGELVTIDRLDTLWKANVLNNGINPSLAIYPERAIVMLRYPKEAPMDSLAKILSILHQAQNEIISKELRSTYSQPFCDIPADSVQAMVNKYPLSIFISRTTDLTFPPPPPWPAMRERKVD